MKEHRGHISDNRSSGPVFAGIDWGGSTHQLCILDAAGHTLTQHRVRHDVTGLADLDEQLAGWPDVKVAIERGEGLLVEHLVGGRLGPSSCPSSPSTPRSAG